MYEDYILKMNSEQRDSQLQLLIKLSEVFKVAQMSRKQSFYLYLAANKSASESSTLKPNYNVAINLGKNIVQEFYDIPLAEMTRELTLDDHKQIQRDLTNGSFQT